MLCLVATVTECLSIVIGPHQITGNGVGFKPDILDMDVMEKVLEASRLID